jgi:hypothetical protein
MRGHYEIYFLPCEFGKEMMKDYSDYVVRRRGDIYLYNRSSVDRVNDDLVCSVPADFTLQMANSCRGSSSVALRLDLQRC